MKCPACGNVLTLMVAGDVTVNVCERGCGGMWFDRFELEKMDEPKESAGEALLNIERNEQVRVDRDRRRSCPKCEDTIMMRHFFSPKKQVEVDECPSCAGFWLDAGELATIRSQFDSDEERKKAADEYFSEVFGAQLEEMRAESQESSRRPGGSPRCSGSSARATTSPASSAGARSEGGAVGCGWSVFAGALVFVCRKDGTP